MKTTCYGHKAPFIHHTPLGWAAVGETCTNKKFPYQMRTYKMHVDHEHYDLKPEFREAELPKQRMIKLDIFGIH